MANSIDFAKNYTGILDEVYQRAAVSRCLNSGGRMVRAGRNAKEILIPKISVTGLGDYTRIVGYKTGSITYEYETHSFGYDRAIRLFADVMDVEESGVLDCFVEAGAELQRTQVVPEGDTYAFCQIAGTAGVTTKSEDLSEAEASDIQAALRVVTNDVDEKRVSKGYRSVPFAEQFEIPSVYRLLEVYKICKVKLKTSHAYRVSMNRRMVWHFYSADSCDV